MKIYVGNLSYSTNDDSLRDAFAAHGEIEEASVVTDRETGRSRGFGFVRMPNDEEGRAAVAAMNGAELDGRTLNVEEARPKPEGGGRGRW